MESKQNDDRISETHHQNPYRQSRRDRLPRDQDGAEDEHCDRRRLF